MFGTAQPLLLSSQPFDVVVNLRGTTRVANGLQRLLRRRPTHRHVHLSRNRSLLTRLHFWISASGIQTNGAKVEIPGAKVGRRFSPFNEIGRRRNAFPDKGMRRYGLILLHGDAAEQTGGVEGLEFCHLATFIRAGSFSREITNEGFNNTFTKTFQERFFSIISYIVFNSPSSFFSLKKETKMKKVEFFFLFFVFS